MGAGLWGPLWSQMGFVQESDLLPALAHQLATPMARLGGKKLSPELLGFGASVTWPNASRLVPLFVEGEGARKTLHVGVEDPALTWRCSMTWLLEPD